MGLAHEACANQADTNFRHACSYTITQKKHPPARRVRADGAG
jgi:hypothetical protein